MIKPYLVAPLLIKQPTWGGFYISLFKNITNNSVKKEKIGQAYELAADTVLLTNPAQSPPYFLAEATDLTHPSWHGPSAETINIQTLVRSHPKLIVGDKVLQKHGPLMPLLIKFTQAQENSYQVHVKPGHEFGKWQPKPESWYYFEKGKVTLGLKAGVDLPAYQRRCQEIYQYSLLLSHQIKKGELSIEQARIQLTTFVETNHPRQYVNSLLVDKDSVVDLSECGIHHSWETDANLPNGNIVYEVQLDQRDDVSSIRSFDQGKLKDDGGVRELAIADYFQALDSKPAANDPTKYLKTTHTQQDGTAKITQLLNNPHYRLTLLTFSGHYQGYETTLTNTFHHLFIKKGAVTLIHNSTTLQVKQGWSTFIPAGCHHYLLQTDGEAEVLKTSI